MFTNNSILVNNATIQAMVTIGMCSDSDCDDRNLQCDDTWLRFTRTTFNFSTTFTFASNTAKDCMLLIQDSFFSRQSQVTYHAERSNILLVLDNSTFVGNNNGRDVSVISLHNSAVLVVNCIFENNTGSPIQAMNSKVVLEGNTTFRNNSALIGAGIHSWWVRTYTLDHSPTSCLRTIMLFMWVEQFILVSKISVFF